MKDKMIVYYHRDCSPEPAETPRLGPPLCQATHYCENVGVDRELPMTHFCAEDATTRLVVWDYEIGEVSGCCATSMLLLS